MGSADHGIKARRWHVEKFSCMSSPVKGRLITTEQAIRRLYRLGYNIEDEVIKNVVDRMELCIRDQQKFASGTYCREDDIEAFTKQQGRKPQSGFETGFGIFYHTVLLQEVLTLKTERLFLDYYLSKQDG